MNLDQLSAFGPGIGGIAVAVSRVYLVFRVRASTQAIKVGSAQNAVSNYESHLLPVQQEPWRRHDRFCRAGESHVRQESMGARFRNRSDAKH